MENYYVMLHDEMRCIGCQACTVACSNLNDINKPFARVQVRIDRIDEEGTEGGRYKFFRVSCQHCENAPCVPVCPTGATFKDDNGVTQVNPDLCIGCQHCVAACPYKVRYMDKAKKTVDKCDFCTQTRLLNDEKPACVSVCPTDALVFSRLDSQEVRNWLYDKATVYQDEKPNTGPLHLYRSREVHAIKEAGND